MSCCFGVRRPKNSPLHKEQLAKKNSKADLEASEADRDKDKDRERERGMERRQSKKQKSEAEVRKTEREVRNSKGGFEKEEIKELDELKIEMRGTSSNLERERSKDYSNENNEVNAVVLKESP
jgi:hypothetical protein